MAGLTWLHLSDWHQKGPDFDRSVVRDALLKDLRARIERIDNRLEQVDFVVFSGDLAFSGEPAEYEAAWQYLLEPVLDAVKLKSDRLFIVPGNHDLNRGHVYEMLPQELQKPLDTDALVQKWLDDKRRSRTLEPFEAYRTFVTSRTGQTTPDYASILRLAAGGKDVALIGLNSAWMCARNKDYRGEKIEDARHLIIGEPQIHNTLAQVADAEIKIVVMHHPFDWLAEFDRNRIEARLGRECHFILRGHEHQPQVHVVRGTSGDCVIIPSGACYDRRLAADPRYTNSYNWVHLDFSADQGIVYLRRWSDQRNEWIEDIDAHPGGKFLLKPLPKNLDTKTSPTSLPPRASHSSTQASAFERECVVLSSYLNALVNNNTHLEPGGIKQTNVQVVLQLDEIYVGLQADRDRPDVDRRVMQEELDEIKVRLEREEDPQEREKQYQIWANQKRILEQALEVSGPREELSNIVQRHRQVVILGDPGSGKTTLLRYLTLRFARAILAEPERILQPQELWEGHNAWQLPDLGPVRLPVLLRISHYAEARQNEPDLALVDYLPRYFAGLQIPYTTELGPLLRRLMEAGRCIVMLDGLDEIIDPADRRNIATAIGQFASVFRETGLPDWLSRSLIFAPPVSSKESPEAKVKNEETIAIQWDKKVPEDVRQGFEIKLKQRRKDMRRGAMAMRLAWELLDEARYAHVGNRFVVTSRIAGYHFAGVPGEFEHFNIRRMNLDDIRSFLEKWCPAVERRIAEAPEPIQVEQRARREIDGIIKAIETTPGVRRMAENPLLLRILAIIHRNEAHLPQRRVELYETATVTLLRDWHLERGTPKEAVIDDIKAMSLLGPVAFYIHENRASGFLSKGETERILASILAQGRGEKDPEQPSLETREMVQQFLENVRQHSGLFVERGEGLYGFMHLTFEEYFTARHLVSSSARARKQILERLHQPRWRETILLAIGSLSKQFYDDTHDLLRAILEANSDYEPVLHRDLLFAAACVGDSVNVAPVLRREIAGRLLEIYCDRRRIGRYRLLQQQIKDALLTLCNDQGDAAVEAALAETLTNCSNRTTLTCALDAVDWLRARTQVVAQALATCSDDSVISRVQELLRAVQGRLPANGNGAHPATVGWDMVQGDTTLTWLMGALCQYGWRTTLQANLGIPEDAIDNVRHELNLLSKYQPLGLATSLLQRINDTPLNGRDYGFWVEIKKALREIWRIAPSGSELEVAADKLSKVVTGLLKNLDEGEESKGTADNEPAKSDAFLLYGVLAEFQSVVYEQERATAKLDRDQVFSSTGSYLLKSVSTGHTLAATFVDAARRVASPPTALDDETLRANVRTLQAEIAYALLALLHSTTSGQQYYETALFLVSLPARTSPLRSNDANEESNLTAEAAGIVCADLNGIDVSRRRWALQTLSSKVLHRHVQLTNDQLAFLLSLLESQTDQATLALNILFALNLTPSLLAQCWAILRRPEHPLADAVRDELDKITELKADLPFLMLLDEGRRDAALRTISLELLRKLSLQNADAVAQALTWLGDEDIDVRHLAALRLATQKDILALPRAVLLTAAKEYLNAYHVSWAMLRDDVSLVRLLSGLWLHGWDEALTQLWVAQSAIPYVDKHPTRFWSSFRTYPDCEECIRWLLEKAEFGQPLIPIFQRAAAHLSELEGNTDKYAPQTEYIVNIQQEIGQEIDALLDQPTTPLIVRTEVVVMLAAIRQEAPPADVMAATLTASNIGHPVETAEALAALGLLLQIDPPPTGLRLWLRSLGVPGNNLPLSNWLSRTLAAYDLVPSAPPSALALLLTDDNTDAQQAASLSLFAADLPAMLLPVLVQAAQSLNDRTRLKSELYLAQVCSNLATDGSTEAIQVLVQLVQDVETKKDRHLGTVSVGAYGSVKHTQPFWVARWLETLGQKDESAHKQARQGLNMVLQASSPVLTLLCVVLSDPTRPVVQRRVAIDALINISVHDKQQIDSATHNTLAAILNDPDIYLRRSAAYALQWTSGQAVWMVAQALLHSAQFDPDIETRSLALRSVGRVLNAVHGFRDVDVSKEALFRWLAAKTKEQIAFGRPPFTRVIEQLPELPAINEMPDVDKVLAALAHPHDLGLPADTARLCEVQEWSRLLQDASQEWAVRRYWLKTLPHLPTAIAQLEALLVVPEATTRRAAACALARLYHGEDDRPSRLYDLLSNDNAVLQAMLDAVIDREYWSVESEKKISYHSWAIKQIASWVEVQPSAQRNQLIATMLSDLEQATIGMESAFDIYDVIGDEQWCDRRALVAVLAELSDRLTYRAFTSTRALADVVNLFARAATDPNSFNSRRFAIHVLGNLQQMTYQVATVFFAACQDVGIVYRSTRTAVSKFKVFGSGSLEQLTNSIRSPSLTVAYHAALLLGELGVSRSEDLGRDGRKRVADELVQLLDDPLSERIVYDFIKGSDGKRVGPLYDVIYEALMRVVAGPDAPKNQFATL